MGYVDSPSDFRAMRPNGRKCDEKSFFFVFKRCFVAQMISALTAVFLLVWAFVGFVLVQAVPFIRFYGVKQ